MCGIAGVIDLRAQRTADPAIIGRMADAIIHRGPDEFGLFQDKGMDLASRRLSIVGLADGQQPIYNEDRTVAVVFNGELFDYIERRAELEAKGHTFRTHADTEILVHLWEEHGENFFQYVRGQFAISLYDEKKRTLILARDRVGICPLHWARQDDWLYIASEIKSLVASGKVPIAADPRGLDHIFTFFAMPSRRTAFRGISSLLPGTYLKVQFGAAGEIATITEHTYWDFDFPDRGDEYDPPEQTLLDEFGEKFFRATEIRLRADVPVVGYLSGGVDSCTVLSAASQVRGEPVPSFTVQIPSPELDETDRAMVAAKRIGATPTVVRCDNETLAAAYPHVIQAADCPVVDTACTALYLLAKEVHRQGFKVALTGEGSDEALAGYPWFKINKLFRSFDVGGFRPSTLASKLIRRLATPNAPRGEIGRITQLSGGVHAQTDFYHLVSMSRGRFYSDQMFRELDGHVAYEDLQLNTDRMRRWHPLNQSLYFGYKTILAGLLLNHKGDRVAMANSVETRYPFLDDDVIAFLSRVHPKWKLRGIRRDKHLLRQFSAKFLPGEIVNRPKAMFRAPMAGTFFSPEPPYVAQLMSRKSLEATPYFDADKVLGYYEKYKAGQISKRRVFVEMGLASVLTTQLWHHLYLGGGLCDLPTPSFARP